MAILVGTVVFFLVILIVFHEVLVPFIVAVVLAYVLYPVVAWLHRRSIRGRTIPRWVAVILIYGALFGVGKLIFGSTTEGLTILAIGAAAAVLLYRDLARFEGGGPQQAA